MRLHPLFRSAVLLVIASTPLVLRAQFQDPTPDELKMTSDPKAPGAPAVYLYREETTNGGSGIRIFYARIKVLTEKGKELATVKIPFEKGYAKFDKVEGRTIHSDGTVIPLDVKPEEVLDFKSKYFQEDSMVFTLPSAEVGSILEYRLQIEYPHGVGPPRWELQSDWFTHKEHFFYDPGATNGVWRNGRGQILDRLGAVITPQKAPVSIQVIKDRYSVDLSDVPPVPDDDWMAPINTLRWRVEFYRTYARTTTQFWDTELKFWALGVNEFAKVTGTIRKAADSLVSPGDTDEQKARKIYAAVQKLDNTDSSRVKSDAERKKDKLKEIHSVEDVWKNQGGAGNSIALLYVALAQAAGLKVWPMEVVDRGNAIFDQTYLDEDQLEDYIAVVNLGGKEVYLDPGQKDCPFGVLHWTHNLAGGFREAETGPKIAWTPALTYKQNAASYNADLTVDGDGNMQGSARILLNSADALHWRQQALKNDLEEVKKQFIEDLEGDLPEGVTATFDHFVGLDDYESNLMVIVNLSGSLGTPTGKRLILPGLFFETRAKHPFVAQDKRTTPIDVHFPRLDSDDVVYHLPPGYAVESAPHTADVTWTGSALLRIASTANENTLEVKRAFARNFTLLAPEDYNNLHDFYLKLAAADQQQIVLLRAAPPKGN
jgi:polyhydroxyalkanoate synthesis regulator phasin